MTQINYFSCSSIMFLETHVVCILGQLRWKYMIGTGMAGMSPFSLGRYVSYFSLNEWMKLKYPFLHKAIIIFCLSAMTSLENFPLASGSCHGARVSSMFMRSVELQFIYYSNILFNLLIKEGQVLLSYHEKPSCAPLSSLENTVFFFIFFFYYFRHFFHLIL